MGSSETFVFWREDSRSSLKECPGRVSTLSTPRRIVGCSITLIFCLTLSENAGSSNFLFRTDLYSEFSETVKGVATKTQYFGPEKCLWWVFSLLPPICTVQLYHWLPCYFLTRFFLRLKKKKKEIAGSKPTMPSEYVSTGHNRVEEKHRATQRVAKTLCCLWSGVVVFLQFLYWVQCANLDALFFCPFAGAVVTGLHWQNKLRGTIRGSCTLFT